MLIDKNVVKKIKKMNYVKQKLAEVIDGKMFLEIILQRMLKNLVVH